MSHCRLRIAHAHCLQFERSGMVLMSHIREASKAGADPGFFVRCTIYRIFRTDVQSSFASGECARHLGGSVPQEFLYF